MPMQQMFLGLGGKNLAKGQATYTTAGSYSWTCPDNVESVSVVCIGPGGTAAGDRDGGGGGGLGYKNNYAVTAGNTYTVVIGAVGTASYGSRFAAHSTDTYFVNTSTCKGGGGKAGSNPLGSKGGEPGTYTGDGGGNGGEGGDESGSNRGGGGGGAGGYSGNGGDGGSASVGADGSGGGGGGGGGRSSGGNEYAAGGGGVGLLGSGSNGEGGADASNSTMGGEGGSGGEDGFYAGDFAYGEPALHNNYTTGGEYGGGGGGQGGGGYVGKGGKGAVRIMWPGADRQYPSTRVADESD